METKMLPWPEYPHFVASLLAILTPFAAVPAYLSLTQGCSAWERSRTAVLAASTAAVVLVIAALIGPLILGTLGVSLRIRCSGSEQFHARLGSWGGCVGNELRGADQ
jgi:hypothetical protein